MLGSLGRLKAVIFDIGGVIEITPRTGWGRRWALRLGLDENELASRLESAWAGGETGRRTLLEIERRTAESLELKIGDLRALMEDVWREYLGTLNVELAEYFAALRPRFRTALLSNSFVGARERERAAYALERLCDVVVYSHEEGMTKPDPRIYQLVCQRLGVRPSEAVFVDDTEVCISGAKRAGLTAVQFRDTQQTIAELNSHLTPPT
jgi:putative hydrolase of the HAD superfamily